MLRVIGFFLRLIAGVLAALVTFCGFLGLITLPEQIRQAVDKLGVISFVDSPNYLSWIMVTLGTVILLVLLYPPARAAYLASSPAHPATPTPKPPAPLPAANPLLAISTPAPTQEAADDLKTNATSQSPYRFIHDRRQHEFHGLSGEKTFRVSIQNASAERRDGVRMSLTSIIATGRDWKVRQKKASKAIDLPVLFMLPDTLGPDESPILEMSLAPSEQRTVDLLAVSANPVPWFSIYTKPDKVIRRGAYSFPERALFPLGNYAMTFSVLDNAGGHGEVTVTVKVTRGEVKFSRPSQEKSPTKKRKPTTETMAKKAEPAEKQFRVIPRPERKWVARAMQVTGKAMASLPLPPIAKPLADLLLGDKGDSLKLIIEHTRANSAGTINLIIKTNSELRTVRNVELTMVAFLQMPNGQSLMVHDLHPMLLNASTDYRVSVNINPGSEAMANLVRFSEDHVFVHAMNAGYGSRDGSVYYQMTVRATGEDVSPVFAHFEARNGKRERSFRRLKKAPSATGDGHWPVVGRDQKTG
jgi:hypothetical protein